MKKSLVALFTMVALAFGANSSFAACPCSNPCPCHIKAPCACPVAIPCCPQAMPCPAAPCCDSCCDKCDNCCDNNCDCGCKKKCRWWKFWENKNCCTKCDCCNKCDSCCDQRIITIHKHERSQGNKLSLAFAVEDDEQSEILLTASCFTCLLPELLLIDYPKILPAQLWFFIYLRIELRYENFFEVSYYNGVVDNERRRI